MGIQTQKLSKASIEVLEAIARFKHQRHMSRVWRIGDRNVPNSAIAKLEAQDLVREVAVRGTPVLLLTDRAKSVLGGLQS